MAVKFAGVYLPSPTPEVANWVERHLCLSDVVEFSRLHWPTKGLTHLTYPGTAPDRPVQLGRLWWPRGASRWATFHYLATDQQLPTIRQAVYTGANTLLPAPLEITSGISGGAAIPPPDMFMLPPRPLAQIPGANGLWLLTLVDARYFWWFKSTGVLTITEGTTTWDDVYSALAVAMGISINHDPVNAAYLTPPKTLSALYEYAPLLLDAVAYNVGQRIVRRTDGTVHAMDAPRSKNILLANYSSTSAWPKIAGGRFLLDPTVNPNDAPPMLPYGVQVTFPRADDGALTGGRMTQAITLPELGIADIPANTLRHEGYKLFHDTCVASFDTALSQFTNQTELDALVKRIAIDFYRHQLGHLDIHLAGIFPWLTEGLSDSVEWIHTSDNGLSPGDGIVSTRVQRPPFNDLTVDLMHGGTGGASEAGRKSKLVVQEKDGSPRTDPCELFDVNQEHWLTWTDLGGNHGELGWLGFAIYHEGQGLKGPKRVLEFIDGTNISSVVGVSGDHVTVTISATGGAAGSLFVTELDGSPYTENCVVFGINQATYLTWTAAGTGAGYISWTGFILHTGSVGLSGVGPHKTLHVENLGGIVVNIAENVTNDWNILYLSVLNYDTIANNRKDFFYWRQVAYHTGVGDRWHPAGITSAATITGGGLPVVGTYYAMPFPTPRGGTIDSIGINVTSAAAAGKKARLGIYRSKSETDLYPGNLELDCGEIAIDSTGIKIATINFTFAHGYLYWLVLVGEAVFQMSQLNNTGYACLGWDTTSISTIIGGGVGWRYASTYPASMPASFPDSGSAAVIQVGEGLIIPAIFVHFSA